MTKTCDVLSGQGACGKPAAFVQRDYFTVEAAKLTLDGDRDYYACEECSAINPLARWKLITSGLEGAHAANGGE